MDAELSVAGLDEIAWLDATSQAALVARKELAPRELFEAAIARAETLGVLNAIVTPLYDEARAARPGGGRFAGVPFLLKDLLAEKAGTRLAEGSAFTGEYVSPRDSELVARFAKAGLVVIGKTNTPELGLVPTTEPRRFGPTRNPWNAAVTTGGSSGGSAAAVAAGIVPMAHANDGGGSIRIPASCCGLFGLKPTRGRNPLALGAADPAGLVCEHAVTRSVRDSAALLDATAKRSPGAPARAFADEVGRDPGRLRIALSETPLSGEPAHPDCVEAVRDVARLCEELGHKVEQAAPAFDGPRMLREFGTAWAATLKATIEGWSRRTGRVPEAEHFEPATWRLFERARALIAADTRRAVDALRSMSRDVAVLFETYDLWLTPTLAWPPVPLGTFDYVPGEGRRHADRVAEYVGFTLVCNVTGQPAMSVPLHWVDDLPVGVHFAARFGEEATLFRLAAQLEAARPWASRRPPVSA